MNRILITGGAGFIGSFVGERLLAAGYRVRALDNLCPQVHPGGERPDYLHDEIELLVGDIRDPDMVAAALHRCDAVIHLAACVGVGQSMSELVQYADVNARGTAVLMEAVIRKPVQRVIVASSMSIYGEGRYLRPDGGVVDHAERTAEQLRRKDWDLRDAQYPLRPSPTPESKPPRLYSVYALNKYDQERMCMMVGRTYSMPVVALRFFNIYGPRQALSNPYTGVLANFASRLLNDQAPLIYEDGRQRRDFVSIHDAAEACLRALTVPDAPGQVLNIASGHPITVNEIARKVALAMNKDIEPEITGKYRPGDIRHCFADITRAKSVLNYQPKVNRDSALVELAEWVAAQSPSRGTAAAAQAYEGLVV